MRISSITKNAGKACNNRLYRHIRTFEKIVKNYFVIWITPSQFFDESEENPALLQTAIEELRKLNDDDLMLIIGNIRRLTRE